MPRASCSARTWRSIARWTARRPLDSSATRTRCARGRTCWSSRLTHCAQVVSWLRLSDSVRSLPRCDAEPQLHRCESRVASPELRVARRRYRDSGKLSLSPRHSRLAARNSQLITVAFRRKLRLAEQTLMMPPPVRLEALIRIEPPLLGDELWELGVSRQHLLARRPAMVRQVVAAAV